MFRHQAICRSIKFETYLQNWIVPLADLSADLVTYILIFSATATKFEVYLHLLTLTFSSVFSFNFQITFINWPSFLFSIYSHQILNRSTFFFSEFIAGICWYSCWPTDLLFYISSYSTGTVPFLFLLKSAKSELNGANCWIDLDTLTSFMFSGYQNWTFALVNIMIVTLTSQTVSALNLYLKHRPFGIFAQIS